MGLGNWLRERFGRGHQSRDVVTFLDADGGRLVRIPASELRPGAIQVRLQGRGDAVWAMPDQFRPGEIQHPEFDEGMRSYIRQIQAAFAEHRSLTFEEWEVGFRRDGSPERELAIWSHAADIYTSTTAGDSRADRRRDVYRLLVACMTTGPADVWRVLRPEVLSRAEAEQLVNRFFPSNRPGGPDSGG